MRVYIAYKYTKIQNKEKLRKDLKKLASILKHGGHETFILGRDIQDWDNKAHPIKSKFSVIMQNIKESDAVVAYINSSVSSMGILFELHYAKLRGKKIHLILMRGVKAPYLRFLAYTVSEVNSIKEINKDFI